MYTRELLRAMLALGSEHEFVLLYRNPALVDTFSDYARTIPVALAARGRLWWDQVVVRKAVRRYGIDVLFNPKYSIPLIAGCRKVWVCHGLDWYVMPEASRYIDRLSHRYLVPRYAQCADTIIAVSETTRQHVIEFLDVPPERVRTVYSGVSDVFREIPDASLRERVRERFRLPDRFVLYAGAVYPPKNFVRLVQAYAKVGPPRGIGLVIAGGENRFLSDDELHEPERLGLGNRVTWLGWVEHRELAVLYAMADALLMPSLFEACPLPLIEAMVAGCPIVTAERYGTKEIAGQAAILVDPESVDAIAAGLIRLIESPDLRAQLIARGRDRASSFSWVRCATETLDVLESVAGDVACKRTKVI